MSSGSREVLAIAAGEETESEGEVLAVSLELATDDEDEAPEDITLATGKIQALERERNEAEAIKKLKTSKKEMRRQKDEFYKQQKESKLSRHLKAFPEEDLKEAVCKLAEIRESEMQNQKTLQKLSEQQPNHSGALEATVGRVKVVASSAIRSKGKEDYKQKEALAFLQNHFYGSKQGRVSILSQRSKRRRRLGRPALNFTSV